MVQPNFRRAYRYPNIGAIKFKKKGGTSHNVHPPQPADSVPLITLETTDQHARYQEDEDLSPVVLPRPEAGGEDNLDVGPGEEAA